MSADTVLVVIDAQIGVVGEAYHHDEVLDNINLLLDRARTSGTPVIYVQHNGPKGDELEPGAPKWPIHPAIVQRNGDLSYRKNHPIPFMRRVCRRSWRRAASNAWSSPGARLNIV